MKLNLIYTGLCAVAMMAAGCTESEPEYVPAAPCESPAVYFSPMSTTSYKVVEGEDEITVPVYRATEGEAATYAVSTRDMTDASMFDVPATVSFAEGSKTAEITITFVAEDLEGYKPYNIGLSIGDGKDTPYALQTVNYTVTFTPWQVVTSEDGTISTATWRDDFLTTFFNLPEQVLTWEVTIEKSPVINGLYRVATPYGTQAFPGIWFPSGAFADGSCTDGQEHYLYLNCADPTNVFMCSENGDPLREDGSWVYYNTGCDVGYGTIFIGSLYNDAVEAGDDPSEYAGTLINGVLKFPTKSMLIAMLNYNNAGFYYSNVNGAFRLIWPGCEEEADPDDVWETLGNAAYTDALIAPIYNEGGTAETWTVELQQWKKDPSQFRLVNPYKDGVMPDGLNYEGDEYLFIDATNPNCVMVEDQWIWYDDEPVIGGDVECMNIAYNLSGKYDDEAIIAAGYGDTYADGVFSFGSMNLRLYFPNTSYADWKGKLIVFTEDCGKIVLEGSGGAAAPVRRSSKVNNFTVPEKSLVPYETRVSKHDAKYFPATKRMSVK